MSLRLINTLKSNKPANTGDTIVEVIISIAVAAFALGTSYAIASNSMRQAITARERNQAVNLINTQIAALKIRHNDNPDYFNSNFTVPTTFVAPVSQSAFPVTAFHFCLNEKSASSKDTTQVWNKIVNNFGSDSEADNISSTNIYNHGNGGDNPGCVRTYDGTDFFIDTSAQVTWNSRNTNKTGRTVYRVTVRWSQYGTGEMAKAEVFYRY